MDMQPLEAPPEVPAVERRRKNQQIVSRGARLHQKTKKTVTTAEEEDPPILMMSSVSGEGDSLVPGSPSKRSLLINEERAKQLVVATTTSTTSSRTKKHGKRNSNRGGGMSSKITRALFRERRSSNHANFSKMDSSAKGGSNFFKRSSKSPFQAVEPRNSRSMDLGPSQVPSEPSFDNASTQSGPVVLEGASPRNAAPNVKITVQQRPPTPPRQQYHMPSAKSNTADLLLEPAATGNVSALSMGSDFGSVPSKSLASTLRANHPLGTAPKAPSSIASSASSLNYSESHASSHDPYTTGTNTINSSGLMGTKLATTRSEDQSISPAPPMDDIAPTDECQPVNTSISDLVQERVQAQERLLERLDQAATQTKRIPTLKPPPSLPPKGPPPSRNKMDNDISASTSGYYSAPLPASTTDDFQHTINTSAAAASLSLKQHEERLLQGGDFMDESMEEGGQDLPLKLLNRLEAAQADAQLMTEHHDQDPPLAMSNSISFGSSTIATLRSTSMASSLARKTSNASSTIATTTANANGANPYAAFMISEGLTLDLPSTTSEQRSRLSAAAEPLMEEEEEDDDDDEADEIVIVKEDGDESATKLCYLYYQNENSILSPSSTTQNSHLSHHTNSTTIMSPLPAAAAAASPMYRSDAIDAFLEQAQTNINSSCSKDHCVNAMEEAATQVLDGGGVVGSSSGGEESGGGVNNNNGNPNEATVGVVYLQVESPAGTTDAGIHQGDQDSEPETIVSEEFLNMMTSGCTGVPNHAAKEAMKERLVALEAGWSGFRNQFNERIQSLEESWQGWNLNSLLHFNSPSKGAAPEAAATVNSSVADTSTQAVPKSAKEEAMTPTTMGSTTVLTTPPTMSTVKMPNQQIMAASGEKAAASDLLTPKTMFQEDPLEEVELISQADDSVVGVMKSPRSMDATEEEIVLGVVRELERARVRKDKYYVDADEGADADTERSHIRSSGRSNEPLAYSEENDGIERIEIGTTEKDVPLSLKHTLADISMIQEGANNTSASSSSSRPLNRPAMDSSRDDSEGGKVMLDAAEWDPVNSSAEVDEADVPASVQAVNEAPRTRRDSEKGNKPGGFVFFKRKNRGKKKTFSPKSVLVEI